MGVVQVPVVLPAGLPPMRSEPAIIGRSGTKRLWEVNLL